MYKNLRLYTELYEIFHIHIEPSAIFAENVFSIMSCAFKTVYSYEKVNFCNNTQTALENRLLMSSNFGRVAEYGIFDHILLQQVTKF